MATQLAITSVWKVRFQQVEQFSVANNELFHMACSTQKLSPAQNRPFSWILIHGMIRKFGKI